jgi:hypothetical protein
MSTRMIAAVIFCALSSYSFYSAFVCLFYRMEDETFADQVKQFAICMFVSGTFLVIAAQISGWLA